MRKRVKTIRGKILLRAVEFSFFVTVSDNHYDNEKLQKYQCIRKRKLIGKKKKKKVIRTIRSMTKYKSQKQIDTNNKHTTVQRK